MVGTALAFEAGALHIGAALAALIGATLLQIGSNLTNDASDFAKGADNEDRVGPTRAVLSGLLTERQVRVGAFCAFALAIPFGLYLAWLGGPVMIAIGISGIAAGVLYTAGPMPLGYIGLGDLFVMIFFGLAAVCGTYFVQTGSVTPLVLWHSISIGALATAILVVNNLRDRHTDKLAGKNTLAVIFGAAFARAEYTALVAVAYIIPTTVGVTNSDWWLLMPLATLPVAIKEIRAIRSIDGAELNPHLGATARLGLIYSLLLSVGVIL
jgi:1,4-dihydroxy-2-naphthoate octaprenyltransferase